MPRDYEMMRRNIIEDATAEDARVLFLETQDALVACTVLKRELLNALVELLPRVPDTRRNYMARYAAKEAIAKAGG